MKYIEDSGLLQTYTTGEKLLEWQKMCSTSTTEAERNCYYRKPNGLANSSSPLRENKEEKVDQGNGKWGVSETKEALRMRLRPLS